MPHPAPSQCGLIGSVRVSTAVLSELIFDLPAIAFLKNPPQIALQSIVFNPVSWGLRFPVSHRASLDGGLPKGNR